MTNLIIRSCYGVIRSEAVALILHRVRKRLAFHSHLTIILKKLWFLRSLSLTRHFHLRLHIVLPRPELKLILNLVVTLIEIITWRATFIEILTVSLLILIMIVLSSKHVIGTSVVLPISIVPLLHICYPFL